MIQKDTDLEKMDGALRRQTSTADELKKKLTSAEVKLR
jgi:hypothetical protein